jgi:hypothetical protein
MDARRRQIVEDAILQMRAAGKALGPEFLARIRVLVRDFDPDVSPHSTARHDMSESIDRKKNLLTIMKFMQLKAHDKNVQNRVLTLLSENKTLQ